MYIDKLDDTVNECNNTYHGTVNEYNNTYHGTIKLKSFDGKSS